MIGRSLLVLIHAMVFTVRKLIHPDNPSYFDETNCSFLSRGFLPYNLSNLARIQPLRQDLIVRSNCAGKCEKDRGCLWVEAQSLRMPCHGMFRGC